MRQLTQGCDLMVIPTTPDALSLDALTLTVDLLQKIDTTRVSRPDDRGPPYPSREGEEMRNWLEKQGLPVFEGMIYRRVAFQKAALQGCLVSSVKDVKALQGWSESAGRRRDHATDEEECVDERQTE